MRSASTVRHPLQLHRLFAGCFWPIYTWRKVTREAILQRQKAGMLKNIYMTASTLTCFRCWAQWYRERAEVWKKCDAHRAASIRTVRDPFGYVGAGRLHVALHACCANLPDRAQRRTCRSRITLAAAGAHQVWGGRGQRAAPAVRRPHPSPPPSSRERRAAGLGGRSLPARRARACRRACPPRECAPGCVACWC